MRLSLAIGSLVAFIIAAAAYSRLPGSRQAGIFEINPPTPYFHYSNGTESRGRVLVVHGLDANKRLMNVLSYDLADAGFEVFSIDLPGHGSSPAPFNAVLARDAVAQVLDHLGSDTNVIGHSLGGALLLDVASDRPVGSMVLFSPAPVPIEKLQSRRVLVYVGQFDVGRLRVFPPRLEEAAETFELHDLAWAGHSGALARPGVIRYVADWLGGDSRRIQMSQRIGLLLIMAISSIGFGIILLGGPKKPSPMVALASFDSKVILLYLAAAGIATAVLTFVPITGWLHLFATDYLIGFQFLTGLVLCLGRARVPTAGRPLLTGIMAAVYVIAVPGMLVISEFTQMMLSGGRWWRFPAIVALSLPFFLADEIHIRPIQSRWKAVFGMLLTRVVLGVIIVTSTLMWNRPYAFLLFIMHFVALFWIVLWFAGGLIYRRTRDPLATALFISIVQAWFFAATFVTT